MGMLSPSLDTEANWEQLCPITEKSPLLGLKVPLLEEGVCPALFPLGSDKHQTLIAT